MRTLSQYFAEVFGPDVRVRKIGVNASLGCPNRDGTVGRSGCIYCNNAAFTPGYALEDGAGSDVCSGNDQGLVGRQLETNAGQGGSGGSAAGLVSRQLEAGIRFYSLKEKADAYLAYFQSYSNTYGDTQRLIRLYEEALAHPGVRGLIIATRPDCLADDLLDYFQHRFGGCAQADNSARAVALSGDRKPFLMIELGVESTLDRTLAAIHRGHDWACAKSAIQRIASRGIPVGVHLIIGLPGEGLEDYRRHIREISALPVTSLKLHQLQVIRGTELEKIWRQGLCGGDACASANVGTITNIGAIADSTTAADLRLLSAREYADVLRDILPLLREDIVVDRLVSESPSSLLLAPRWGLKPSQFAALLERNQ